MGETFTIRRLADLVDETATAVGLTRTLASGQDVLAWIRRLVELIDNAGRTALLDQLKILPSQTGVLRRRSELRYDEGIGDQLKVIANELGIELDDELLDAHAATREVIELLTPKSQEEALEDALDALTRSCVDVSIQPFSRAFS